jgi:hypothetical protein
MGSGQQSAATSGAAGGAESAGTTGKAESKEFWVSVETRLSRSVGDHHSSRNRTIPYLWDMKIVAANYIEKQNIRKAMVFRELRPRWPT